VSESWLSERNCLVSLYAQRGKTAISVVGAPLLTTPLLSMYACVCVCVYLCVWIYFRLIILLLLLLNSAQVFISTVIHSLTHSFIHSCNALHCAAYTKGRRVANQLQQLPIGKHAKLAMY